MAVPFIIEVHVKDNEILDELQAGVIKYLENNEFALIRKQIREYQLTQMDGKVQREQLKLDSLKMVITESIIPRGNGSGFIYGEPLNPVEIYREAINLFDKELNIYQELALLKNIELVEGFTKFMKPFRPKLWINLTIGLLGGLLTGFIIAFYLETKERKKILSN